MSDKEYPEIIQLTEESLIALLQGKDVWLNTFVNGKPKQFRFRGPWDGVFLTHKEISNLENNAQMSAFKMVDKLQKIHTQKPKKDTCDKCGGRGE